jgi:hypothetical protein
MKNQFIQLTSGWIPVSVLVLLAIALITGQARANLPNELIAAPVLVTSPTITVVLTASMLKKLETLPVMVDTLVALPGNLEVHIDARILTGDSFSHKPTNRKSQ